MKKGKDDQNRGLCETNRHRAFERNEKKAKITYSQYNSEETIQAVMCNSGEGGMYFETDRSVSPGTDLHIRLIDFHPDAHAPEARDGYRAEVMWCRKIFKDGNSSCYGVGVRFLVNVCDICGDRIPYSKIHLCEDYLVLCPECIIHKQLPQNEKIGDSINNFLLGNVL